MEMGLWQYVLLAVVAIAMVVGVLDGRGRTIERLWLIGAGFGLVMLDIAVNFVGSWLSLIPNRRIAEVLLFYRAPPGDVLVPIAYALIVIGVGSLLRRSVVLLFRRNCEVE